MINHNIDALVLFADSKHADEYKKINAPIGINENVKEDFLQKDFKFFIGDVEGFSKCLDWMMENNVYPEKVILLDDKFNPKNHIKKETIIIKNVLDLESVLFWEKVLGMEPEDIELESFTFGINNIFEIGGVVDEINLLLQNKNINLLDVHNSIFKISQFLSSLYFNGAINKPSFFYLKTFENRESVDLLLELTDHDLEPSFLLDYLSPTSKKYSERLLFSGFQSSVFSEIDFTKSKLVMRLRFHDNFELGSISFKIDKVIEPLELLIDPEKISAEKTGVFLDLNKEVEDTAHPGVEHQPVVENKRKKNVEELIVKVLAHKENYNDTFDLGKIRKIVDDDPNINSSDYSEEELQRVCDVSNDVESTVVLARAKEDVFTQVVKDKGIEEEIVNSINSMTEEDLPFLVSGKGEIDLEEDGSVTVKEPDEIIVDDKFVILGNDKIEKGDLVQKINSLTQKIKEEIITVKGKLKNKEDVDNFIIQVAEKEAPELKKYGHQISRNIMSGFLSKKVDKVVNSSKSWEKMNELINSYKKKVEQRDKQIASLSSTIDTLKFKSSEMHPAFKEIVENTENKDKNKESDDSKFERIIKRKDQYIKKLEGKLIDKQAGEVKVIKADSEGLVKNEVVFKNKAAEKFLFKENDDDGKNSGKKNNVKLFDSEKKDKDKNPDELRKDIEKFKNIGKSMANKIKDLNKILKDYKSRSTDLLVERNKLRKDKQMISLADRKSKLVISDLELKLSKFKKDLSEARNVAKKEIAAKEAEMEKNYNRKVTKLESMNQKLSEGTKSLAKKLTDLQSEHNKMKNDKRAIENRLRHNEIELEKYKETLKAQLSKKTKAA